MLARCAGGDKAFPLLEALFETQEKWAFVRGQPGAGAVQGREAGRLHAGAFDTCLNDKKTLERSPPPHGRPEEFGVNSTPTFFINGKRLKGTHAREVRSGLAPLLNG